MFTESDNDNLVTYKSSVVASFKISMIHPSLNNQNKTVNNQMNFKKLRHFKCSKS